MTFKRGAHGSQWKEGGGESTHSLMLQVLSYSWQVECCLVTAFLFVSVVPRYGLLCPTGGKIWWGLLPVLSVSLDTHKDRGICTLNRRF
jgi:hypothetical protein